MVLKWEIGHRPTTKQWRLNTSLLNDKGFISFITEETYLETSALPETNPLILWDCAIAYIRGRIISFTADKIKKLEHKHKYHLQLVSQMMTMATHRQLNSLLSDKIEVSLIFTYQKYFEYGNRASKLLAFRLRKQ